MSLKKTALKLLFGQKVRKLRMQQNLTQEEMAFRLNTSLRQFGRIERGESNARMDTISRVAEVLNVEPGDLFNFDSK